MDSLSVALSLLAAVICFIVSSSAFEKSWKLYEARDFQGVSRWGRRAILFLKLFGAFGFCALAIDCVVRAKSIDLPYRLAIVRFGLPLLLVIVVVWKGCDMVEKSFQKLENTFKQKCK